MKKRIDYYEFDAASDFKDIIRDIIEGRIDGVDLEVTERDDGTVEIKGEGIEFIMTNQPLERTETQGFETEVIDDGLILIEIDGDLNPNRVFMALEEHYRGHITFMGG